MGDKPSESTFAWVAGVALFGVTLLAYLPAVRAAFIWNDAD